MTVFDPETNPPNPDDQPTQPPTEPNDSAKEDTGMPEDTPQQENDPNQPREAGTTINVPQTSVQPPGPVYDEPGEIGIPNVVPEGYDPTQQPYGEKHGVPQPPKTVDEAEDADLLDVDRDDDGNVTNATVKEQDKEG